MPLDIRHNGDTDESDQSISCMHSEDSDQTVWMHRLSLPWEHISSGTVCQVASAIQ